MEGKSSAQRERFFFKFTCQLSGPNPEDSEFETFLSPNYCKFVECD